MIFFQQFIQACSFHIFHHHKMVAPLFNEIIYNSNIRMQQLCQHPCFFFKPFQELCLYS